MTMFFPVNFGWVCLFCIGIGALVAYLLMRDRMGAKTDIESYKDSDKKFIAIGLRDNAEYFADLYEPMCVLANGNTERKDAIFQAWVARAATSEGSVDFKRSVNKVLGNSAKWRGKNKKFIKTAKKMCKYMELAGLKRDQAKAITAVQGIGERYELVGRDAFIEGVAYDVLAPFWYNDAGILCRGVVR